jgi:aryl-alcohol dehydrogenase-like predicted oxidoreductase
LCAAATDPVVSAPIVGATKPHHLAAATAALDIELTQGDVDAPEAPYDRHGPSWF